MMAEIAGGPFSHKFLRPHTIAAPRPIYIFKGKTNRRRLLSLFSPRGVYRKGQNTNLWL
jgi:hypothetical protein